MKLSCRICDGAAVLLPGCHLSSNVRIESSLRRHIALVESCIRSLLTLEHEACEQGTPVCLPLMRALVALINELSAELTWW